MTPSLLILSALAHAETPDAAAAADGAPVQVVVTEISAELPADAGASPEAAVVNAGEAAVAPTSPPGEAVMPPVQQPSRADLTDAALQQRFIDDAPMEMSASGLTTGASPATPWWMWPLGLLGVAGVAGLVMRQRQLGSGVPSDILVLSRTAVSRSASLAVIEVTAADNTIRRLLVGVGGGAPRIVADLSSPAAAQEAAAAALEDAWMQPEEAPAPAKPAASAPAAVVEEDEESITPRRRGAAAYAAEQSAAATKKPRRSRRKDREDLLAEVLAERESDRSETPDTGWKDPWARNFEALLGQQGGSGS